MTETITSDDTAMTNITESPSWEESISLIARNERVTGGQDGVANRPLKGLANRTRYLKKKYDEVAEDVSGKVEAVKTFAEGATLLSPRDEIVYGNYRLVWTGNFLKMSRLTALLPVQVVSALEPGLIRQTGHCAGILLHRLAHP